MSTKFEITDEFDDKIGMILEVINMIIRSLIWMIAYAFVAMYLVVSYSQIITHMFELSYTNIAMLVMIYLWGFILMILILKGMKRLFDI